MGPSNPWLTKDPPECREDDTNWPKKNIVGKQELEVRIGNDHIAFEVRLIPNVNSEPGRLTPTLFL